MKLIKTCGIFMNEVVMEEQNVEKDSKIGRNLQFSEE
jgi:hypothetical protein